MKDRTGESARTGLNRTGITTSGGDAREMLKATERAPIATHANGDLQALREAYMVGSEPVGSVPPPASVAGMERAVVDAVNGVEPTVLLDRLGERLAFERTGTRLYEAVLAKFDALGTWDRGPTREALERIHLEELSHVALLTRTITAFGGDPTVQTPSADVQGVAALGIPQVVCDPRTDLHASLEAMLVAELTDNESWETLVCLVAEAGRADVTADLEAALGAEQRHLDEVRAWLAAALEQDASTPIGRLRRRARARASNGARPRARTRKASPSPKKAPGPTRTRGGGKATSRESSKKKRR